MDLEARLQRLEQQAERELGTETSPGALRQWLRTLTSQMRLVKAAIWYGPENGQTSIVQEIARMRVEQRISWTLLLLILGAISSRIFGWL